MTREELWEKVTRENECQLCLLYIKYNWSKKDIRVDKTDCLGDIQKLIPEAYELIKRPFGVNCKCSDGNLNISVKAKGDSLFLFEKKI